jgi:hypothetical protein
MGCHCEINDHHYPAFIDGSVNKKDWMPHFALLVTILVFAQEFGSITL